MHTAFVSHESEKILQSISESKYYFFMCLLIVGYGLAYFFHNIFLQPLLLYSIAHCWTFLEGPWYMDHIGDNSAHKLHKRNVNLMSYVKCNQNDKVLQSMKECTYILVCLSKEKKNFNFDPSHNVFVYLNILFEYVHLILLVGTNCAWGTHIVCHLYYNKHMP